MLLAELLEEAAASFMAASRVHAPGISYSHKAKESIKAAHEDMHVRLTSSAHMQTGSK